MAASLAVKIDHLVKRYGKTEAVRDLSLEIQPGEIFGLLGPNGAGKSSTIHCLTGIATITSGSIQVYGHDVVHDFRIARRRIGLAPQEFNVDIFARPWQILDYMAGYYGMHRAERRGRTEELLERFGLQPHRNKRFRELSGGLKRRVMLARAMVHDPQLLILDEPTAGVDVALRHELWHYLRQLHDEGKTLLMTSHYIEEVEQLAGRVAIIHQGELVASGTMKELVPKGKHLEDLYLQLTTEGAVHA